MFVLTPNQALLIGWRIHRRYGITGLILFILLWSLWGMIHDYGILYTTCQMEAEGVLHWVGGPANADLLRR